MKTIKDVPCPVCGSANQFTSINSFGFCSVCGWQSDWVQLNDPDFPGANEITLNEARKIWKSGKAIYDKYPR
jgi:endogenous inhibitor of DNA gyrase (YacG/DUF329 family)